MTQVFIGLGSNMDDPRAQLHKAIKSLHQLQDTVFLCQSSFYQSKPVGPRDQPDFINAVVKLDTGLTALVLLDCLQEIEVKQGRQREGAQHWGPRTLDLDILIYGKEKINNERLTIPHPELHKRNFVLLPLNEIEPGIEIPGIGPVSQLIDEHITGDIEKLN